jgi:predicted RND superfamily exporter protein
MDLFVRFSLSLLRRFRNNPIITLSATGAIILLAVIRISTTEFGTDLLAYIPKDAKLTRTYLDALKHAGGEKNCYILLEGNMQRAMELSGDIALSLKKLPGIAEVQYRVNSDMKDFLLKTLRSRLPLYLDADALEKFLGRLSPDGMEETIKRTRLRLAMPGGSYIGHIDPLGFSDFVQPFTTGEDVLDASTGYYLLPEGKGVVIIARVTGEPRDLSFDRTLIDGIDVVIKSHIHPADNISVTITGSHAITYFEATQMKKEIMRNILSSLILVVAIILLFIRDIRMMAYAFVPVSLAILFSLAFSSLVFGSLTETAGGFGAMLIGLGVDLPIVLYVRNIFLRNTEDAVRETARGIWAGALTTFATFSPMVISHFRGVRELGVLISAGIIICAVLLFCSVAGVMKPARAENLRFHLSMSGQLLSAGRYRVFIMLVLCSSIIFSLWKIQEMKFSVDIREIGTANNPARIALDRFMKEDESVFITGDALDAADAVRKSGDIAGKLRASGINNIMSLSTFIPPLEKQMEVINRLKTLDVDEIVHTFSATAKRAGLSGSFILEYTGNLREMLSVRNPVVYEDIGNIQMVKDRFLWAHEKGYRYLLVIRNADERALSASDGNTVTGKKIVQNELAGFLREDTVWITISGFFLVNVILFLVFRNPLDVLFAQIPIITGILFTGALLTLMGRPVHIMSAITGVMLFGTGTDYAIHLIHHLRRGGDIATVFSQTGTALVLCALTTICGFGTLYFSSYRGLSDMGLALTIGTVSNLFFTFLFVLLVSDRRW